MGIEDRVVGVVKEVFEQCLDMKGPSIAPVAIVFDDYGRSLAESFARYCGTHDVALIAIYCHYAQQLQLRGARETRIYDAIRHSDVLVSILSSADECTEFRVGIVSEAARTGLKTLHLPGGNEDILLRGSLKLDYKELHGRARRVSAILSAAGEAKVLTKTGSGEQCELVLRIQDRTAHACGGIAERGEILNLPTGEAYIAPVEGTASGSLVINGSGPKCVFHNDDEVILHYEEGCIDWGKSRFSKSQDSKQLQAMLKKCFAEEPDGYQLGELGIGLNRSIKALSGEVILDEKKAGTAHIAMGNNKPFGGSLRSKHHHDLIFVPIDICIDGEALDPALWR